MSAPPITVGADVPLADAEIRQEILDRVILCEWLMSPGRFVVRVRDGVVCLQGRIERRSLIPALIAAVRGADGVVAVDARLTWDRDDTQVQRRKLLHV